MIINRIKLNNFRFHESLELNFKDGLNLISGPNGIGKTNIIEAIYISIFTKSFLPVSDDVCVRHTCAFFEIELDFTFDCAIGESTSKTIKVSYSKASHSKVFYINEIKVDKLYNIIGLIPCVFASPFDFELIFGPPELRRAFLNILLSQISKKYLENLIKYKKILLQRNRLLLQIKYHKISLNSNTLNQLDIWTDSLIAFGAEIIYERLSFISSFKPFFENLYQKFHIGKYFPSLLYNSFVIKEFSLSVQDVKILLNNSFKKLSTEEYKRGTTLIGPHREDIDFFLNNQNIKRYFSQGQIKLYLTILKAAQRDYYHYLLQESPIFISDDAFEKLDNNFTKELVNFFSQGGQTILTNIDFPVSNNTNYFYQINLPYDISKKTL